MQNLQNSILRLATECSAAFDTRLFSASQSKKHTTRLAKNIYDQLSVLSNLWSLNAEFTFSFNFLSYLKNKSHKLTTYVSVSMSWGV